MVQRNLDLPWVLVDLVAQLCFHPFVLGNLVDLIHLVGQYDQALQALL